MADLNPDALRKAAETTLSMRGFSNVLCGEDNARKIISRYLAAMAEQGWELRRRGLPEFPDVEKPSRDVRDIIAELPIRAIREPGHE